MNGCNRDRIDRHFEGALPPNEEKEMRAHLPDCEACRAYYQRHLLLASLDPNALPAEERIARGLGFRRKSWWSSTIPVTAAALLAAALIMLFVGRPHADTGFASRGSLHAEDATTSRIVVFRVPKDGTPMLASGVVGKDDELAFSYENGAHKARLLVYGVDEHGHIYWFYPGWTSEQDNPVAVPIASDSARHELPEAIRHRFDGTKLAVHGVFVDSTVTVREMESILREHPAANLAPGSLAGAIDSTISLAITP